MQIKQVDYCHGFWLTLTDAMAEGTYNRSNGFLCANTGLCGDALLVPRDLLMLSMLYCQ